MAADNGYTLTGLPDDEQETTEENDLPEEERLAQVGAAKAASALMRIENLGFIGVPDGSCYGAAVALPQIARSAGWSVTYTGLCLRVYLFLSVVFCLQMFLLAMVREETHSMDSFSGQMHLCDFGKNIAECPNAPNCRGPGGTSYTYPRLYSYDSWALRNFVKSSLLSLFPDKQKEIEAVADPGEWGLENYYCRLVCLFIFMMAVVDDLKNCMSLVMLLIRSPTKGEMWITYEVPEWGESKQYAKKVRDWSELDLVKFRVAGMPLKWKIFNALFVVLPKLFVWVNLCSTGFHFLMETSTIVDVIVNSVALKFILDLDEMILDHLASTATRYIVSNLQPIALFDKSEHEMEQDNEARLRFLKEEKQISGFALYNLLFPKRLFFIIFMMSIFVMKYYYANCIELKDGSMVSKPMYPLGPHQISSVWELLFGIAAVPTSTEPFWSMPEEGE